MDPVFSRYGYTEIRKNRDPWGWVNHLFKQLYFCCNLKEVKISTLILSSCKLLLGWISIHEINYVQSTLQRTWPRTRHGSWRGLRWLHCHTSSTSCFLLILGAECGPRSRLSFRGEGLPNRKLRLCHPSHSEGSFVCLFTFPPYPPWCSLCPPTPPFLQVIPCFFRP